MACKKFFCNFSRIEPYEIPKKYEDSFYFANASFYDSVNYFIHATLMKVFPKWVYKNKKAEQIRQFVDILEQCNPIVDVRFDVARDNGKFEVIRGFCAQHGRPTGNFPSLGGLRIYPNVTRDVIKGLAVLATYKNGAMQIPLSGTCAGIKIDPHLYSGQELKRIVEQFSEELFKVGCLGGGATVFQPDFNTDTKVMDWIARSYGKFTNRSLNTSSSGKSENLGGFFNSVEAGPLGAFYSLQFVLNNDEITEKLGISKEFQGKTFVIFGLGETGSRLAKHLESCGAICVGVKEQMTYLYKQEGVDLKAIIEYKCEHGTIDGFEKAKPFQDDVIYRENCDILIFTAYEKILPSHIADKIQAKIIVEAVDGAISPISCKNLLTRSKCLLPDIFSANGMQIVSYMEYIKTLQQLDCLKLNNVPTLYQNCIQLHNEQQKQQLQQQQASHCLQAGVLLNGFNWCEYRPEIVRFVVEHVGQDILRVLKTYNLNLDIRTAAYILSIENLFRKMYETNKYTI